MAVPTDTPAALATATLATSATTATPALESIRDVDFSMQQAVRDFIMQNGGEIDPASIIYADLTEDGEEEAVVPVASGGTLGNLDLFVFGMRADGLFIMIEIEPEGGGGIAVEVADGELITTEGVFAADDPACCPSEILTRHYVWDGEGLSLSSEEQVAATPGVR